MNQFFRLILMLSVGVCAFVPFSAHAATADTYYVSSAELPPQLLPAPPLEKSLEWKKDVHEVLALQDHVKKSEVTAIRNEQHISLDLLKDLTEVVGPNFSRENNPKAYGLMERAFADTREITEVDKTFWGRRRPYLTDKNVKILVDRIDDSPSFPSGHTSTCRVVAEVLGMLYPDRLSALRAQAELIAHHRIEAGAHYPDDIEGGRLLAMLIVGALSKSEDFQNDLAEARKEVAEQ